MAGLIAAVPLLRVWRILPLGEAAHLDFPDDAIPTLLPARLPRAVVSEGRSSSSATGYTGALSFELQHTGPLHVRLETNAPEGVYTILAQPD